MTGTLTRIGPGTLGARRRRVVAIFTGGTISSTGDPVAGGAIPTLGGAQILQRVPGITEIADVLVVDYARLPSSHFTFADLFGIRGTLELALSDPSVDGAVLVQGTDTIEETSFFLDLLYSGCKPLIVTGSMRTADSPDLDGPTNLRDALRCAADPALENYGVLVALAGTIEPADDVVKTHSTDLATFRSPNRGSVGRIEADQVEIDRPRRDRRHVATRTAREPIAMFEAGIGTDDWFVAALTADPPAGIVIEATGSGNTRPALLDACSRLMRRGVPVVLTTRACAGMVTDTYAFPGSGGTWLRAGALRAGYLNGRKARIALALGLGAGLPPSQLAAFLAGSE